MASVSVCCISVKQRSWPCEQVIDAAYEALVEHAAAQHAGACEGCCQAAQALVVTLRKSLMRLDGDWTDRLVLTGESVALVCAVPPCPAHHALLRGPWLTRCVPAQLARLTLRP